MRKIIAVRLFIITTLAWAATQQTNEVPPTSAGQATSPSTRVPDSKPSQSPQSGTAGQSATQGGAQPGMQGENLAITQGCLGCSNPNYTITDTAGTTYRLNIPPGADASSLQAHLGEPVAVLGPVNKGASSANPASIDVNKIGRGTGSCPSAAPNSTGTPPPQKQ